MSGYGVGYFRDVNDRGEAKPNYGKWGSLYVILVDPDTGLPYRASGGGGGGGDASAANQLKPLGPVAPGTAAANSTLTGMVYTPAGTVVAANQQLAQQSDASGNLKIRLHGTAAAGSDALANTFAFISGHNQSTGNNAILPVAAVLLSEASTFDRPRGNGGAAYTLPAPRTGTDRSRAINTSVETGKNLAANAVRSGLKMQNGSDTATIYYAYGVDPVVGALGTFKLAPGATEFLQEGYVDKGEIRFIASATANLNMREW